MTQFLPPQLLLLFQSRTPIPFLKPIEKKVPAKYGLTGVASVIDLWQNDEEIKKIPKNENENNKNENNKNENATQVKQDEKIKEEVECDQQDNDEQHRPVNKKFKQEDFDEAKPAVPLLPTASGIYVKERHRDRAKRKNDAFLKERLSEWDPHHNPQATGDPYKTLFVGRLSYNTSERRLRREFEIFGPIKTIAMVFNKKTSQPRGYAFLEFEHEKDMHEAYNKADGMKLDGHKIVVDVERGRTVRSWKPRSLGGGLGTTRKGAEHENQKHPGRERLDYASSVTSSVSSGSRQSDSKKWKDDRRDDRKDDRRGSRNFREDRRDNRRAPKDRNFR